METGNSTIMNKQRIVPQIMLLFSIFAQVNEARLAPRTISGHRKNFSTFVGFASKSFFQEIVEFLVKDLKSKHLSWIILKNWLLRAFSSI